MLANALNSAGVLYLEQEDYEKASDHLRQSLQIYQELKNQTESARVLLNLGVTDQRRGNFDQALESFRKSLNQAEAASDKDLMMAAGEGLGVIYRERRTTRRRWKSSIGVYRWRTKSAPKPALPKYCGARPK